MKVPCSITINDPLVSYVARDDDGLKFVINTKTAICDAWPAELDAVSWTMYAEPVVNCPGTRTPVAVNAMFCPYCGVTLDRLVDGNVIREHLATPELESRMYVSETIAASSFTFTTTKEELAALIAMFQELYDANYPEEESR